MNEKNREDRRCSKEQMVIMCSRSLNLDINSTGIRSLINSHPHLGIFVLLKTFLEAPFKFSVATRTLDVRFSSVKLPGI